MTLPCAARSTLVYLERGDAPRCTKALSPFNQTSWQEMWCPGVILGPSNTQLRVSECLMWGYNMIFSQLNGDPCPAWTTERGKLKRGWSPGDSLNLVRVLSVRVNYSQQCRNDINGRWEYSKSIIAFFKSHPGPWFNITITSYQYRKSHCGDKTILPPSYLHNGVSYTGKTASLYWIGPQISLGTNE